MIATTALDRFRAGVLADSRAAQALARYHDPVAFEAAAIEWADAQDIPIVADDLRRRLPPIPQTEWPPIGWLPVSIGATVEWLHFARAPLVEAFFDDSIRLAAARPFNRLFRCSTPLAALIDGAAGLEPSGMIFHMSRCGSTLAAQMLAAVPGQVVVSEPQPIDAILAAEDLDEVTRIAALRALASAFARCNPGGRLFLKLDSWHSRALPLLRRAFPETGWVFLYREPVEVLVSHLRQPGRQTVPGLVPAGFLGLDDTGLPGADFTARVLAQICKAVLDHWDSAGALVNYCELPDAVLTGILPHFGVNLSPAEREAMAHAGRRDSKRGGTFAQDAEAKRREAPADVRSAAQRHLAECHARLCALRNRG